MRCLYINLDSRPDRRQQAEAEFKRVGLTVERFPGVVNDNPVLGFNKAVYGAMIEGVEIIQTDCGQLAFPKDDLLLFEDDVVFDKDIYQFYKWHHLHDPHNWLPKDWMTFHIGANIIGTDSMQWQMPTRYSEHLAVLHNAWQSHATLYSAECVKYIIENFPYWKDEYQKEGCQIFDEWLRLNVLPMGRSYVLKPMIAYQRPDFSNIWNSAQDYTSCHTRGNQYLNSL